MTASSQDYLDSRPHLSFKGWAFHGSIEGWGERSSGLGTGSWLRGWGLVLQGVLQGRFQSTCRWGYGLGFRVDFS